METEKQYWKVLEQARNLFVQKNRDYGLAWQVLRTSSLTDQILIKAQRIRNLQENKVQKVADDETTEFIGIINYALLALIQLDENYSVETLNTLDKVLISYDQEAQKAFKLMQDKNHDYGEIWRQMRISAMTDLILMKLFRIRQIEEKGVQYSEGLAANFQDILNYAIFCLILEIEH